MSMENALREMIRRELEVQLGSLRKSIGRMEQGLEAIAVLRKVSTRLTPLAGRLGALSGVVPSVPAAPARRGAGRARAPAAAAPAPKAKAEATKAEARSSGGRSCAIIGCKRPSRSKGYCSAHYQKLRLLKRTGRVPAEWVDDAAAQSVPDVKLPRGRAASKDRQLQLLEPQASSESPKPKAWVRKKGAGGLVSLH